MPSDIHLRLTRQSMNFFKGRVNESLGLKRIRTPSALRWIAVALATAFGYFFATQLGFAFKFQPHAISVFWPANAVVLAALLLTPIRIWGLIILFLFPAHLAVQWQHDVPWPMLLSWYVSNSFESLLGAAAMRLFTGERVHLSRLRDICIFYLCGALPSVFISSLIDSAFVELNGLGNDYWELVSLWFLSNFFASIAVVPVIVTWSTRFTYPLEFSKKVFETIALAFALFGVTFISFCQLDESIVSVPACLCLPLPIFLWAAARFGVRGVSTTILAVAIFATWASIHRRGPFTSGSPQENALSIQTFFTLLSLILVPMAAVFSEKKQFSQALHASEQRYRMVVETQPDMLCRCLADTTLTFVNDAWCRFFGRSREELIGRKILDFIPSSSHEYFLCHFAKTIVKKQPVSWQCNRLSTGRNPSWRQWMVHPIISDDGHIREIQATARDITELKCAEEALRESEERYRGVVEAQPDLVSRYLLDSTLIFANQSFFNFFEASRKQLIGRKLIDILPSETREKFVESIKSVSSRGKPFIWEFPLRGPDDHIHWQQWISCAITNSAGQITAIQSVGRDITSQKQAEEATRNLAHVSRLVTIGELTAIIVHEVSQPLNAILLNVSSGEKLLRHDPVPINELLSLLADIRHDSHRAVEAVRRVRAFSRKNEMEKIFVHPHTLIEDVLRLLSGEILRRHIQVHIRLGADVPIVLADPFGLQQVILNLIVNAMDAVHEVPEKDRSVWIDLGRKGEEVVVSVKDNGHGIRPEFSTRIFESFFTTKREGLGLGLSISRSIIQAHGGSLWAENNIGGGATFSFVLPIKSPTDRPPEKPPDSASSTS
jgi:PAS domain S-box-containing protein